jgi:(4S)-4-hydroxy-5-phosphonooxypentane-2,3-dione isomerase
MKIVIVRIQVLEDKVDQFIAATLENLSQSLKEPGISRFELLREEEGAERFVLVEGYRDAEAQAAHKESAHYKKWRDEVEPMMAEPRTRAVYKSLSEGFSELAH